MAIRWLELDSLDNQNISSALEVGSYTCDADRHVFATLYAQGLAGNGDYIYYVTVTPSGLSAGIGQKTTHTLASGETTLFAQTIGVALRNGDIMKVYLDGLAGDTTTPDTRVNFFEDGALSPTTAGRTLDVSAGGEAGVDWANVGSPTTTLNLSGTTIKTASDVETDTADIQTRIPAALTANGNIKASLVEILTTALTETAGYLAAGFKKFFNVATPTSTMNQVTLVDTVTNLTNAGTTTISDSDKTAIAQRAWDPAYVAVRTVSQTAAQVSSAISGTTINVYRDATVTFTLTGLTDFTGYSRIWFTAKEDLDNQPDSAAILHLMKSTTDLDQTGDGLVYLNGASATLSDGSITVNSTTSITVTVKASAAASLPLRNGIAYGVKALVGTTVLPVSEGGALNILATAARAIA